MRYHIFDVDCVCRIPDSGNFFAHAIGFIFNIPVIFLEKENNEFYLEQFNFTNKKILMVDDVITTRKSLLSALKLFGGVILIHPYVFCLVSYLRSNDIIFDKSIIKVISGIQVNDADFYTDDNCLLCQEGSTPVRIKKSLEFIFLKKRETPTQSQRETLFFLAGLCP